jgi:hypothetical protein
MQAVLMLFEIPISQLLVFIPIYRPLQPYYLVVDRKAILQALLIATARAAQFPTQQNNI